MATTNDKGDGLSRVFKTASGRALQIEFAKAMNEKAWKDMSHPGHLTAVTKVYNIYRKLHASK